MLRSAVGIACAAICCLQPARTAAETRLSTSDHCGSCHRDIFRMWRDSAHAEATEDPFFLEAYRDVEKRYGAERSRVCLDCHAPMAIMIDDPGLEQRISREGVNCDFCHSLVSVELAESGPSPTFEFGEVKRGTIRGADSNGHEVAYSELHKDSVVCAPCHEYVTADGTPVLTTYSEWKSSRAAERGETCQSCHMGLTEGDVVDPRVKRESGARINLHQMPGARSIHQLLDALDIKISSERGADGVAVQVRLTNEGAGHAIPTGMPGRRILMEVSVAASDGASFRESRTYSKQFADEDGKRIREVGEFFFASGVRLESDSRIGVDERRTESFLFPVADSASAYVTVKLHYEYAPRGEDEERLWRTFFSHRDLVKRSEPVVQRP